MFSLRHFPLVLILLFFPHAALALAVSIQGMDDSELQDNIKAHIGIIGSPVNCEMSDNYQQTIEDAVATGAQALGYYKTKVHKIRLPKTDQCDALSLSVEQGPRIKIRDKNVQLDGAGKQDKVLLKLIEEFTLNVGSPLEHKKYETLKNTLQRSAQIRGYFDARFTKQEIQVDLKAYTASIDLRFTTGARYKFGELSIPQDDKAQDLIREIIPFTPGDDYHADKLAQFNQNLKLTGYFQQVVARPLVSEAQDNRVPIEVITTNKPKDTINIGGGFSTDTGPRVRLKWQRPWVNSRGHSLSADVFASAPEQNLSIKYKIPLEDPLDNYLSFQGGAKAENDNDTVSEAFTLAVQRHWGSADSDWKRIAFLRFEQERFRQGIEPRQTTTLLLPGATLSRRRTRGGLDLTWGDTQQFTVETASKQLVSDIDLTRLTVQSKWLRSFAEHRIFIRAELGAIATSDFSQVPSSLRYFAGGDQSVRGFGYETLSPLEGEQLTGGQYLNVASVEYSYPVTQNWRGALFTDIGNASDRPFKNLATGVGFGASWMSPVGPIRIYFAFGHSEDENTKRLHFSMGPVL
ncbi:MAG: translocation and assembly module TamA [Paraglaciecola sp.]